MRKIIIILIVLILMSNIFIFTDDNITSADTGIRVVITSDPHYGDDTENWHDLVEEIINLGADVVLVLGDITKDNAENQWEQYQNYWVTPLENAGIHVIDSCGNHESSNSEYWIENMNRSYSCAAWTYGNSAFILTERSRGTFTKADINWLKDVLSEFKNDKYNVFFSSHYALAGNGTEVTDPYWCYTVGDSDEFGLMGINSCAGFPGDKAWAWESRELLDMFNNPEYSIKTYFNGHMHVDEESFDNGSDFNSNGEDCWTTDVWSAGSIVNGSRNNGPDGIRNTVAEHGYSDDCNHLPNGTYFANVGVVYDKYTAEHSSFRYFDLVDGEDSITFKSWKIKEDNPLSLNGEGKMSYDEDNDISSLEIPLDFEISNGDFSFHSQSFHPFDVREGEGNTWGKVTDGNTMNDYLSQVEFCNREQEQDSTIYVNQSYNRSIITRHRFSSIVELENIEVIGTLNGATTVVKVATYADCDSEADFNNESDVGTDWKDVDTVNKSSIYKIKIIVDATEASDKAYIDDIDFSFKSTTELNNVIDTFIQLFIISILTSIVVNYIKK